MSRALEPVSPENQEKIALPLVLLLGIMAFFFRIDPFGHPANLTPIGAMALFGGARLRAWWAFCLPLAIMAMTDLFLWTTKGWVPFNPYVYGSFVLMVLIGRLLTRTESVWKIGTACLAGSVLFFLITNFGVWLGSSVPVSQMAGQAYATKPDTQYSFPLIYYAQSFDGLMMCYVLALPFNNPVAPPFGFFGNLLIGDLFFTGLVFSAQALLWREWGGRLKPLPVQQDEESRRSQE